MSQLRIYVSYSPSDKPYCGAFVRGLLAARPADH